MIDKEESDNTPVEETNPSAGVKVPEQFQKDVDILVSSCANMEQIEYISSCLNGKRADLYDAKQETDQPEEYSSDDEPKD